MFSIITCVVISITSFSTTKKPTKNRKKTEPNCGNTTLVIVREPLDFIAMCICLVVFFFDLFVILPLNELRSPRCSLGSLPHSRSPPRIPLGLNLPYSKLHESRDSSSLQFIPVTTRKIRGYFALKILYLHMALNRSEVEALAFLKPSQ